MAVVMLEPTRFCWVQAAKSPMIATKASPVMAVVRAHSMSVKPARADPQRENGWRAEDLREKTIS
jgi:hypothetical protein